MSPRVLKRVALALGALLVLWGAVELFVGRSDVLEQVTAVAAVTEAAVDSVEFLRQDDTVRLVKHEGQWRVNGHRTGAEAVGELFAALEEGVNAELVARNPASHARMGVDSAGGRFRIVAGGTTKVELILGKQGPAYRSRYVRPVGDDRVYLMEGELARLFDREEYNWRDLEILALEPDSIGRIAVERGDERYVLGRADTVWTLADGSPTDSGLVRRMLDGFRRLTAQGAQPFATAAQADSADFARPDARVTLFGSAGDTLAGLVFDSTDSGFWVRHDSGGTVYNLMRWKVNELLPAESSVKQEESEEPTDF